MRSRWYVVGAAVIGACSSSTGSSGTSDASRGPGEDAGSTKKDAGSAKKEAGVAIGLAEASTPPTCTSDEVLCSGACVVTASCAFSVTAIDPPTGWLNGHGYLTIHGAGFAAGAAVSIGDGKAPALVLSSTEIFVETPPGPLGPQDVSVTLSATTATLRSGFTYQSAGLTPPWVQRGLSEGRASPALSPLQDGRALIAGGTSGLTWNTATTTADIYAEPQPSAELAASAMSTQRFSAAAVTLLSGEVVVAGGACSLSAGSTDCLGNQEAIDLFDPKTNGFTQSAASLPDPSVAVVGVLLTDGRALFINNSAPRAALYDPTNDSVTAVAMPIPGQYGLDYPFMVRLRDGRVLVGSGDLAGGATQPDSHTFLFDPTTNTFTATGAFAHLRSDARAATLPDGRVLVAGGSDPSNGYVALSSIELYDPTSGTFSLAPYSMTVPRDDHAIALVRDGTVLLIGGDTTGGVKNCTTVGAWTAAVDQVDPVMGNVSAFAQLAQPVEALGAIVLADGSVLAGGGVQCGEAAPLPYVDFMLATPSGLK